MSRWCRLGVAGATAVFLVDALLALLLGFEAASLQALDPVAAQLASARYRGGRRRGSRRAALFRSLDRPTTGASQRSTGGRSRRAAADAGCSGPAIFTAAAAAAERDHRTVSGTGSIAVSVAIIDYGSGNLHSAAKAFERASARHGNAGKDRRDPRSRSGVSRRSHRAARCRRLRRLPPAVSMRSTAWSRR